MPSDGSSHEIKSVIIRNTNLCQLSMEFCHHLIGTNGAKLGLGGGRGHARVKDRSVARSPEIDDMGNELACWKALESFGDIALHYYLYRNASKIWPEVTSSLLSVSLSVSFQRISSSSLQAVRKLFLSNAVFTELAILEGFPERILITPQPSLAWLRFNPTVLADAFEAHIGAVEHEYGREGRLHELEEWIGRLFSPAVFPTLVEVGESRNNYLKRKREATKEKRAKGRQRKAQHAQDEGVAVGPTTPSQPQHERKPSPLPTPPDELRRALGPVSLFSSFPLPLV